ncbi:MAG: hypothetical protein U1A78_35920 [Polyangia bacterium]
MAAAITAGSVGASEPVALIPAARCGECHGQMELEWRGSAHARADRSPLYQAMRAAAGADCDRCHAPLRALAGADPIAAEGVSCDVCHTIDRVSVGSPGGAGFVLRIEDSVRYGPLCDALPHYFHTMGCSPLHKKAELCAACHDLRVPLPSGERLAIYPEYGEWLAESGSDGPSCQSCHMPSARGEVAVGSPERPAVASHTFFGRGDLRRRALSGRARIGQRDGAWQIALALTNSSAGHAVPTGLPERQLVVSIEALDAGGRVLARTERSYGRVLVDAAGRPAPFYAAVRQLADFRIRPGETLEDSFTLRSPEAARLRVLVVWRPIAPALAAQLGVVPPPDEPMLSASAPLPALSRRAADSLVELAP